MTKHEDLIAAVELIGRYVAEHLPEQWQIVLEMRSDEATLELRDPDDGVCHVDHDYGQSAIAAMCDHAQVWRDDRESVFDG